MSDASQTATGCSDGAIVCEKNHDGTLRDSDREVPLVIRQSRDRLKKMGEGEAYVARRPVETLQDTVGRNAGQPGQPHASFALKQARRIGLSSHNHQTLILQVQVMHGLEYSVSTFAYGSV